MSMRTHVCKWNQVLLRRHSEHRMPAHSMHTGYDKPGTLLSIHHNVQCRQHMAVAMSEQTSLSKVVIAVKSLSHKPEWLEVL